MYVLPAEEAGDDSYEPPPAEQETRTVHPALPFARGEYVGESLPDLGHSACRAAGSGSGQGCRVAGSSRSHHLQVGHLVTHRHWSPLLESLPFGEGEGNLCKLGMLEAGKR